MGTKASSKEPAFACILLIARGHGATELVRAHETIQDGEETQGSADKGRKEDKVDKDGSIVRQEHTLDARDGIVL